MRSTTWRAAVLAGAALGLASCRPSPAEHLVTISWAANRETGVNKAGGGYRVSISGQPTIDVPWVSGATAPTSIDVTLFTGRYTVTVAAYAALDPQGGSTGSQSAPSQVLAVKVP